MPRSLRVVQGTGDAATEVSMADAIMAIAAQCAADRPGCVLIVWERAEKSAGPAERVTVEVRTLPQSRAVMHGLVRALEDLLAPDEAGE